MNEDWIKFLQFAIKEDVEQPDSVEDIDWESLFLFMRKQSLGGVLMYGVNKLKGVKIPRPVLMKIFMFSDIQKLIAAGSALFFFAVCVSEITPIAVMLFDKVIAKTTIGFLPKGRNTK